MSTPRLWAVAAVLVVGLCGTSEAYEVLGSGTEFLLGDDLTDLGDDGDQFLYNAPDELGEFDAIFFSSDEPGFEGGEFAFNVFDNILGPSNDKWCCGTSFPQIVGADFRETQETQFRLTHFTVSSANDIPDRDPRVWSIQGSNDGECWTTIFSQNDPNAALWTDRLQVILFEEGDDYEEQETAYSMFRMVTFRTGLSGGAFFQIGEIEFFGEEGDPPGEEEVCGCSLPVFDVACEFGKVGLGEGLNVSWEIPDCECTDETQILIDGVEVRSVAPDATSAGILASDLPDGVFSVEVRNCSDFGALCTPFKTDSEGYIIGSSWLALGPFSTPIGCDGDANLLASNQIGPEESIACQYPADGDPIEGYEPGDPFFPSPDTSSTLGYHVDAPTDDDGNPIWRPFQDTTLTDADLDFDQDIVGNLDEHMMFIATWIENLTDEGMDLSACFGSDDDGQVWLDDQILYNTPTCRGRAQCQDTILFTLPPGVHVIKIGIWEQGGGWGTSFSLNDRDTLEPIVDLAGGFVDLPVGASPLSTDIVFHGRERPEDFEEPECGIGCPPVAGLMCERADDGTIDMFWENDPDCESEIRILAGGEVLAVLDAGADSYTIEGDEELFVTTVAVDNGGIVISSCSVVEFALNLLGSDLTDIDDDGDQFLYNAPDDFGGFDAEFFSSDEPGFEGGEFAYNVFDNILGPTNDKWCCGTSFPQIVGADFSEFDGPYRLTHFTVSSANDVPGRDPRVWRIEGSDDGEEWTTIFSQNEPSAAIWTERLQVAVFREGRDYPVQTHAYWMFRMVTDATGLTGGAFFQVGEIEFFGEEGDAVGPGASLLPGDVNGDGGFNIADMVAQLGFLFGGGGLPECYIVPGSDPKQANATGLMILDYNGDGSNNIADAVAGLAGLFGGGGPHALGEECVQIEGTCESNCTP